MEKVQRSAMEMLEYGVSRVWHSQFTDVLIDRNTDNTEWKLAKVNPTYIEYRTSNIESLRTVARQEFGVDVDQAIWVV